MVVFAYRFKGLDANSLFGAPDPGAGAGLSSMQSGIKICLPS
jgi:hypothetical protein